jgi:large subunit ribosomal protein L25
MELAVEKRDKTTNVKELRRTGKVPAVVYGRSEASTPITIDRKVFEKLFHEAGESTVITLKGLGAIKEALINEVALHPVSGAPLHVDFYAIEKGQMVTVSVPLEFEGVSPAVKDLGGVLVKVMHELEIECEPKDLPQHIIVDISKLKTFDDQILVKDLALPALAVCWLR